MKLYIQSFKGMPVSDLGYTAYLGACQRGIETIMYEDKYEVPQSKATMLVTNIEDTQWFLGKMGIDVPPAIEMYQILIYMRFIKRRIEKMKFHEFMNMNHEHPLFVKPAYETKSFPSGVVTASKKKLVLSDYKGNQDAEVFVSEVVDMVSEYRVFVRRNRPVQISGVRHYAGDPFKVINEKYVNNILEEINIHVLDNFWPTSYTADFAVLSDGRTELIEFNDGWSIGPYGLEPDAYFGFLLDRWLELMGTSPF